MVFLNSIKLWNGFFTFVPFFSILQTNQQIMRSRLDKILNRNVQEPSQTNRYVCGRCALNSMNILHEIRRRKKNLIRFVNLHRVKSSKPDVGVASKRMSSVDRAFSRKPSSAYPKARGLVTK